MKREGGAPKTALASISRQRLFPAGLPEASLKTKLYGLIMLLGSTAFVVVTLVDLTTISFNGLAFSANWILKAETLIAAIASLVLYRAHRSWAAEDYHALRDQLLITTLTVAALWVLQALIVRELLQGIRTGYLVDLVQFRFMLIEGAMLLGLTLFTGMNVYLTKSYLTRTDFVDGYIVSLRPQVKLVMQLTAIFWIGWFALRLFVNAVL